jgi:hypothetical protein
LTFVPLYFTFHLVGPLWNPCFADIGKTAFVPL